MIGAFAAAQQGAMDSLLLAAFLFTRARPEWRARRIPDRRYIAVHAHPRFHEAFTARPGAGPT